MRGGRKGKGEGEERKGKDGGKGGSLREGAGEGYLEGLDQ